MSDDLQKLKAADFKKISEWFLTERKELDYEPIDDAQNLPNALYAFVSQNEALYVGKTKRRLAKRLDDYKSPLAGQPNRTRSRCNREIKSLLKKKKKVLIYALIARKPKRYGGFYLNLAAGLEDSVIKIIQPDWNRQGKEKRK